MLESGRVLEETELRELLDISVYDVKALWAKGLKFAQIGKARYYFSDDVIAVIRKEIAGEDYEPTGKSHYGMRG
jgi:hypothetical protein